MLLSLDIKAKLLYRNPALQSFALQLFAEGKERLQRNFSEGKRNKTTDYMRSLNSNRNNNRFCINKTIISNRLLLIISNRLLLIISERLLLIISERQLIIIIAYKYILLLIVYIFVNNSNNS